MSNLSPQEFDQALVNVRKAYRLLHDYQRRVMDTVNFIGDDLGFEFYGGWTWFSNFQPFEKKVKLDKSAWDWLNMYEYEFHFGEQTAGDEVIRFSILHQADTGFYDGPSKYPAIISQFASAMNSESRLIFIVGRNDEWDPRNVVEEYWRGKNTSEWYDPNKNQFAKAYPLKDFINEEKTKETVSNFIKYCRENYKLDLRPEIKASESPDITEK